jgi:hypothetical protein
VVAETLEKDSTQGFLVDQQLYFLPVDYDPEDDGFNEAVNLILSEDYLWLEI